MYADYQFYLTEYPHKENKLIPESGFSSCAERASEKMDYLTWSKITGTLADKNEVRCCCCEIAEAIYRYDCARDNEAGAPLSSWSNDGESGSYDMSSSEITSAGHEAQIGRIARKYLLRLGLLNRRC